MQKLLIYFFMGIGLSMDAFSLSLSLGTINPSKKQIFLTATTIGLFHLFMPLIGSSLGFLLKNNLILNNNYLSSLIFLILGIEMYFDNKKEDNTKELKFYIILLIALTVSIDSLSVGLAYSISNENVFLASSIFMILSMIFTYIGLSIGKKIKDNFPEKANLLGSTIMFIMSIKYLLFP